MSPPVETFSAAELPTRVLGDVNGKRRKGIEGLKLEECEMLEILQYSCVIQGYEKGEVTRESIVQCTPIARLFRRCQDRKGSFLVETTAWEGEKTEK
ncbi:hypothetical protein V499_09128 [Pseudogymnoascus sp. VKM F-103]|uniref:Uncharacterized protein n=1 Tax=Pseudogymnoascus verrucosus TaxID=342668 RepID=A0A1B8GV81_9PEZI|nr:uncharacterized protein VE01_02232 [Pseudogymnoascus verrucosus]KFY70491.1 hypothetical protein V499_09128 [Pseudogymnoascus sp. VKM F-103]OBT99752.1 hypothetical protein VE01_02232 [Pseudogymnoascus verrucosus]